MSHHCGNFARPPLSRREMLSRCANGIGAVALAALACDRSFGATINAVQSASPISPFAPRPPHFAAKAKSVIFLYMDGGPSQVDTFDPKPLLTRENGQPFKMKMEPTQFNNIGATLGSPWVFRPRGQCGTPVSDLFPHVGDCADDLAVVRSMVADFPEHTTANCFLHTGHGQMGRPSMGAWATYGLGSECDNLPGFVVLNGGLIPPGGTDNFSSGFLPATYQASIFKPQSPPVANIHPSEPRPELQQNKLALMRKLDRQELDRIGHSDPVESAIANYELAFRMQMAAPELTDLGGETAATTKLYGLNSKFGPTAIFARECLMARRLIERGVRFVELTCPNAGHDRWDQHGGLKVGHENNARAVDQPIAGLLKDLKSRGLFDSTLVVWAGEFGRTPFAQGADGRDHNPFGFSIWLAGGGIRGGICYGATDEYGYKAVENKVTMHDLHATMLHLLGLDHKRVTYRFGGRDMRLTDVYGEVVRGIIG
jgi:Protein of unknown function (DUF1501)